jgi:RNA methyltransferase, TrmH family
VTDAIEARFGDARRDRALAVVEGFHAVKHALRFGAAFDLLVCADRERLEGLARALAPDVAESLREQLQPVDLGLFRRLSNDVVDTGVIGIARRPATTAASIGALPGMAPVVVLHQPSHFGNIGAAIRVSAAASAEALLATGPHDVWNAAAIRGSAGLHFALPVLNCSTVPDLGRPTIAVDPDGDELDAVPDNSMLLFGSERRGLPAELLERADRVVRIPMRAGVSSLNLATAVAVVLYQRRARD